VVFNTDAEVMAVHLIHGATTFKEVSVEDLVGGAESEGSFLLEFPGTITSNEEFAEYFREKKRKREICGSQVNLAACLSTEGAVLPPQSMALVKNRLSSTRPSFFPKSNHRRRPA